MTYELDNGVLVGATVEPVGEGHGDITPKYVVLYPIEPYRIRNLDDKTSYHLSLWEDKTIQHILLNQKSWHAGESYWEGHYGLNNYAIGIAIATAGYLGDRQKDELHEIIPLLVDEFNIRDVVTCDMVCAYWRDNKKTDVGLEELRRYAKLGNAESAGRYVVTVPAEVFEGPDPSFAVVGKVDVGSGVKVLRSMGDWRVVTYRISSEEPKIGWVYESALRRL